MTYRIAVSPSTSLSVSRGAAYRAFSIGVVRAAVRHHAHHYGSEPNHNVSGWWPRGARFCMWLFNNCCDRHVHRPLGRISVLLSLVLVCFVAYGI